MKQRFVASAEPQIRLLAKVLNQDGDHQIKAVPEFKTVFNHAIPVV